MQEQPLVSPVSPKSRTWRPSQPPAFGKLLQKHRSRAGYSQAYLAQKAHFSSETISALERGTRRPPHADSLKTLIDALELIGDERLAFETAAAIARARPIVRRAGERARVPLLPAQLTPLVGRDEEIGKLRALVAKQRLVTLTGFSGVGKTRVALEFASQYSHSTADDVWLIDLAGLDRNSSVPAAVASVVGELRTSGTSAKELGEIFGTRRMLLVFDHCEHVISPTSETALAVIQACPNVRVLVASSELLGVGGEIVLRLTSLSLPDHLPASFDEARRYSAIALFIDRAEAETKVVIGTDKLKTLVEICRRLDGVPRAIELAAARLGALGFENLLSRLNERHVLSGGGRDLPAHKQAPLEAIAWSYAGLSASEQMLLRRLAIFAASYTLEDAEVVCTDDALEPALVATILESLVHKSLVVATPSDSAIRYRLLEFVRSYAREKLIESEAFESHSQRYAQWVANTSRREAADGFRP